MQTVEQARQARRQLAGNYEPTEQDSDAARLIRDRYVPEDEFRLGLEQQWATNIAYLRGLQYMTWDPTQRQLVYSQSRSLRWKARSVHNLIRPYVERDVATMAGFKPRFKASPPTNDPEDITRAETSRDVATAYWEMTRMNRRRYDLLYWLKVCGNAFMKCLWDPRSGALLAESHMEQMGEEMVEVAEMEYEGDLTSEIVAPFSIHVDNYTQSPEDLTWIMQVQARPMTWLEDHFPDRAPFVTPGVMEQANNPMRWSRSMPAAFNNSMRSSRDEKDWALVKELWEIPTPDFPRGRLIIEANGIVLRTGDNPHPTGKLPFVWVRDSIVPGMIWGQCNVDNMLSPQRAYNRIRSKRLEHIVNLANPKILEHATNKLPASSWSTEVGEVITWNGTERPDFLAPPPLPSDIDNESDTLLGDFDRITSQYGPARGQNTGRLSGKAIYTLIEQDLQSKSPAAERIADGIADWASLALEWLAEYAKETRLIRVIGRARQFNVLEFKGTDLGDSTTVFVDVDSVLPKSKTMALEFATQLTQAGYLNPMNPEDRVRVFRSLAMEDEDLVVQDKSLDTRRAMLENQMMFLGQMVEQAQWFEDHDAHAALHTDAMKSDEFKDAPPLVRALFEAHMKTHHDLAYPQVGVTVDTEAMEMEGGQQPQRGGGGGNQQPGREKKQGGSKAFT